MKLGIVDMEANFVPGSGNQMGCPPEQWKQVAPLTRLERVLDVIDASGFEYLELGVPWLQREVTNVSAETVKELLSKRRRKVAAFCSFMPEHVKTAGPEFDMDRIEGYLSYILPICQVIGGDIIVFGSAPSRGVPHDFDKNHALEQLRQFLCEVADSIERNNFSFRIAIEPLNTDECNMVNSLGEAYALAEAVDSSHIGVLLDLFHAGKQPVPFEEELAYIKDKLFHIHLAQPEDRGWPGHLGVHGFDFDRFFSLLKSIGYEGNASVECKFDNLPEEIEPCFDFLQDLISRNYGGVLKA